LTGKTFASIEAVLPPGCIINPKPAAHCGGLVSVGLPTASLLVIDFADDDWRKLAARSGRLMGFVTRRRIKRR
jgi:hypothetical protein